MTRAPFGIAAAPVPTLTIESALVTTTASRLTPPLPSTSVPNRTAVSRAMGCPGNGLTYENPAMTPSAHAKRVHPESSDRIVMGMWRVLGKGETPEQAEQSIEYRERMGRASGNPQVDLHPVRQPDDLRAATKRPTARRAGAHRDHEPRIRHRGVRPLERLSHVRIHDPGDHDAVGVT